MGVEDKIDYATTLLGTNDQSEKIIKVQSITNRPMTGVPAFGTRINCRINCRVEWNFIVISERNRGRWVSDIAEREAAKPPGGLSWRKFGSVMALVLEYSVRREWQRRNKLPRSEVTRLSYTHSNSGGICGGEDSDTWSRP